MAREMTRKYAMWESDNQMIAHHSLHREYNNWYNNNDDMTLSCIRNNYIFLLISFKVCSLFLILFKNNAFNYSIYSVS